MSKFILAFATMFSFSVARAEMGNLNSSEFAAIIISMPTAGTTATFYLTSPMNAEEADLYYRRVVALEGPSFLVEYDFNPRTAPTPILLEAIENLRNRGYEGTDADIVTQVLMTESH